MNASVKPVLRLLWLVLLAQAACLAGEAAETPASASDDPLAALVRDVRKKPEDFTYTHLALAVAGEAYPDLTAERRRELEKELDRLAGLLKARPEGARTGKEKVEQLAALLHGELGLKTAREALPEQDDADYYFPHATLARKQGVCLGLGLLYLMLAERTGLPLSPVHAPQHLYLRYDDGRSALCVEPTRAGHIFDEEAFQKTYKMEPGDAAASAYFRPLGKLEVLGDLLNALSWFSALDRAPKPLPPERAILAARLCVEIAPADYNNWDTLAQALAYAQRPREALAALRKALALRPPVSGRQGKSYWDSRLKRFEAAAERAGPNRGATP
jgi:regulator of sirC expression with transglutaminase-like and TPR domain